MKLEWCQAWCPFKGALLLHFGTRAFRLDFRFFQSDVESPVVSNIKFTVFSTSKVFFDFSGGMDLQKVPRPKGTDGRPCFVIAR